jgi:hypothetical protein
MIMKPKLYCDQDGVFADFATPAEEFFKVDFSGWVTLTCDDWQRYKDAHPNMWEELPVMPHAHDLWAVIQPYLPSVLTAVPNRADSGWHWDGVEQQKLAWFKKHFPTFGEHPDQQLHAVARSDKRRYAQQDDGTPNILIDDLVKNVTEWNAAGGIGLVYSPSPEAVNYVAEQLLNIY